MLRHIWLKEEPVNVSRKMLCVTGAVTALGLVLSACAPGGAQQESQPTATKVAAADFAGKSMTYVYFTDGPDEQVTRDLLAAFTKKYKVKVNLEILPYSDLITSVQARMAGGKAPDVIRTADIAPFRSDLLDLSPLLGKDYVNQFVAATAAAVVTADKQMLGVPSDLTLNGPFVNVDLFKKAGVPLPSVAKPWTWEEMIAAGKSVQKATRVPYAFAMDKSGGRVSTVLSQYGTQLVNKGKMSLDKGKAVAALQPLVDMMADDSMPRDLWLGSGSKYKSANDIFLAGDTPIYLSGNWQVGQFAKNAPFTWAAVPNPCSQECGGFPGGKYMVAFKSSPNPALSAFFIEYMNNAKNQAAFVTKSGNLPTRVDLTSGHLKYPSRQADMDVFLADLARTPKERSYANSDPAFSGSATALIAEMDKVVAGKKKLPAAIADLQKTIESLVKELDS
jgi:alpha-1,4-digalacturonate transport system substrate-binding protein